MSLVSLVCTFVLVFSALCAARVLYVESLDEFSKCFPDPNILSLPESPGYLKPYYGVFLRAPLSGEMISEFSSKYPLVKHFQQIGTFFYAICIDYDKFKKHLLTKGGANEELIEKVVNVTRPTGDSLLQLIRNFRDFPCPYPIANYFDLEYFRKNQPVDLEEILFAFCIKQTISDQYIFCQGIKKKQEFIGDMSDKIFEYAFANAPYDFQLPADEADKEWMAQIFERAKSSYKSHISTDSFKGKYLIINHFSSIYGEEAEKMVPPIEEYQKLSNHMHNLQLSLDDPAFFNPVHYLEVWKLFNQSQFITTISISLDFLLENLAICHKVLPDLKKIDQIAAMLRESNIEFFENFENQKLFDYTHGNESIHEVVVKLNESLTNEEKKELKVVLTTKITELKKKETQLQNTFVAFIRALVTAIFDISNWVNKFVGEEIPADAIQMIMETYLEFFPKLSYLSDLKRVLDTPIDVQANADGTLVEIYNPESHPLFYHFYLLGQVSSEFSRSVVIPLQNLVIKKTNSSNAKSISHLANIIKDYSFVRIELENANDFLFSQTKSDVSVDDANEIENDNQASIDSLGQIDQPSLLISENPNQPTTSGSKANDKSLKRELTIITDYSKELTPNPVPSVDTPLESDDKLLNSDDLDDFGDPVETPTTIFSFNNNRVEKLKTMVNEISNQLPAYSKSDVQKNIELFEQMTDQLIEIVGRLVDLMQP